MNNLTQSQIDSKQAYLDRQAAQMLIIYQNAGTNERNAVVRQINLFLSVAPKNAKTFWLKFRHPLERLNVETFRADARL